MKKNTIEIEVITLYDYLKARKISIAQCSRDTGIPVPTLYWIWKGKHRPNRKNYRILLKYTGGLVRWE